MHNLNIVVENDSLVRIAVLGFLGFAVSILITPIYTTIAYKKKWWKKQRIDAWNGGEATVYAKLHAEKHRHNIPTMAGLIFVTGTVLVTLFNLNRNETWLPMAAMLGAGAVGLLDDYMNIRGKSRVAGMQAKLKYTLHSIVALIGGWWFFAKLGVVGIHIPFAGTLTLGVFIVPLFYLVVIATANAVNISDGLDGLAGGLLATSFGVYGLIAALETKYGLAAFCITVAGSLLAYTWFNIFPARFFMGDVGSFAMGTALGVVAMLTNTVFILPIIGFVYVAETGSVIINRASKKLRNGKKVFLSSPIHHHFEAIGWPETKITMRFWVIGQVMAFVGLILFFVGGYL
jgi:phospho-N-acetylmuramoyl-pentapeptide-transferase